MGAGAALLALIFPSFCLPSVNSQLLVLTTDRLLSININLGSALQAPVWGT